MSLSIDTNVLVRLLVRDDETQVAAARRSVDEWTKAGESVLVTLCALMETEWVLRSRFRFDRARIAEAFHDLLLSDDVTFEHEPTVEAALDWWATHPKTDFADCLIGARAWYLGAHRFLTFDRRASRLPHAELLI